MTAILDTVRPLRLHTPQYFGEYFRIQVESGEGNHSGGAIRNSYFFFLLA